MNNENPFLPVDHNHLLADDEPPMTVKAMIKMVLLALVTAPILIFLYGLAMTLF